ncbi:hypothetical protein OZN62_13335 [Aurantiacibacter sp. MUD11]|uniref:hypothetical protein n=1 Tax=Aurantiacibacter sp. MUD11 TaxID=3003265 RepID=UPI0022AAAAE9|nr:hypothetical protein [Aurantiacibacter sp. MUD11]WAT17880.1 hypothetical protein OZN62_13335 [Aurantiacibacter sp. MUD11]
MKTRLLASLAAFAAVVVTPATAAAQEARDIVVEGEAPEEPATVREAVQTMAREHGRDVPSTRFFDELCVSVSGLNAAGNAYVAQRILENAAQAGLDGSADCSRANALVLVWHDPAGLVERIKDEQPWLLPEQQRNDVDRAIYRGEQVLVWHNEETYNAGGRPIGFQQNVAGGTQGVHNALSVETRVNNNGWPRRVDLEFSRAVISAVIIVDADVVPGMEIDRLADYATMRLMAPDLVPLDEPGSPSSVTSPFPVAGGPDAMTRFDRAYLEALYDLAPNAPAIRLAGAVARAYEGEE